MGSRALRISHWSRPQRSVGKRNPSSVEAPLAARGLRQVLPMHTTRRRTGRGVMTHASRRPGTHRCFLAAGKQTRSAWASARERACGWRHHTVEEPGQGASSAGPWMPGRSVSGRPATLPTGPVMVMVAPVPMRVSVIAPMCNGLQSKRAGPAISAVAGPHYVPLSRPAGPH
jgi:hypothetical protein